MSGLKVRDCKGEARRHVAWEPQLRSLSDIDGRLDWIIFVNWLFCKGVNDGETSPSHLEITLRHQFLGFYGSEVDLGRFKIKLKVAPSPWVRRIGRQPLTPVDPPPLLPWPLERLSHFLQSR